MGEHKTVYYIYLKNGKYDLLKVMFYYKNVEYYKEDGDEIVKAFREKFYDKTSEVVNIEKDTQLTEDLFDVVI
jgi:hypothetical protein